MKSTVAKVIPGLVLAVLPSLTLEAQSVAAWLQIKNTDISTSALPAGARTGYMTVTYHGIQVTKQDNWWTKVVQGTARAAVVVKGTNGGDTVGLAVTGIEFKDGNKVEFGTRAILFSRVPASEEGKILIETEAKKFADDGLKEAIDGISSQLGAIVEASALAQANLIYSGAKVVLDGLFKLDLNQPRIASKYELNIATAAGTYVVFAANSSDQYNVYRSNSSKLKYSDGLLTFDGAPIKNVTYAIYSVSLTARRNPDLNDALTATGTSWQSKYYKAEKEAASAKLSYPVGARTETEKELRFQALSSQTDALYALLDAGEELILADTTLTGMERRLLILELFSYIQSTYELRLEQLSGETKIGDLAAEDKARTIEAVRKRLSRHQTPAYLAIEQQVRSGTALRERMHMVVRAMGEKVTPSPQDPAFWRT